MIEKEEMRLIDCPFCGQFVHVQEGEPVLCPKCQTPDVDIQKNGRG